MTPIADVPVLLKGWVGDKLAALGAELVLDLVPQLDMPRQVLICDGDPADGTCLFGHQGLLGANNPTAGVGSGRWDKVVVVVWSR